MVKLGRPDGITAIAYDPQNMRLLSMGDMLIHTRGYQPVRHPFHMRSAQLEALVLGAVHASRAGHHEDDRFEFKRKWPGQDKARQLAGSANRARGEALIYVIGLEEDGTILPPEDLDPATWFAQLESRFDGPAPELRHHLRVAISDTEAVVALEFDTDAAPYVVSAVTNGGSPEREVPIRVGTHTRSATRNELLRLLAPTLHVPRIEALTATLALKCSAGSALASLSARVYFEHVHGGSIFLPVHESFADLIGPPDVEARGSISYPANDRLGLSRQFRGELPPLPTRGPAPRLDGLDLPGPGTVPIRAEWTFPIQDFEDIGSWGSPRVRLSFGIAGTEDVGRSELWLDHRVAKPSGSSSTQDSSGIQYSWRLADTDDPPTLVRQELVMGAGE